MNKERAKLKSMQEEARMMEKDLRQREMQQSSHATFPIIQRVHTLRQEIQVLQEECRKMTDEVDLYSDIQVPLGETNEEFYKNIYTGQHGWVLLPPLNAQSHASQNFSGPDNTDHLSRESSGRNRNDPTSPGMHIPRNLPGERVRESTDEGLQSGLGGEGPNWTCSMCTFHNHPALDKCEQCEMPRIILGMPSGGTLISRSPCYPQPNSLPKRPSDNLHHDSLPAMSEPSHSHPAADSCELRAVSDNILNMPHSGSVVSNSPNSLQSNYNIPKRSFENVHTESLPLDSEPSQNHPVLNSCELQVVPSELIN
ncbi:hypothetical protein J437_LFUL005188 [Ladona fulva]|uniref:RanBP2-type domain-containing protein n=1 Tax=Ladona fulva TaxID=123851 RepID=A0A8K0P7T6_LADFU|nr:hypothetical protein J437_LFUL005188 [Ladona fulva]